MPELGITQYDDMGYPVNDRDDYLVRVKRGDIKTMADEAKAFRKLKALAEQRGVELPSTEDANVAAGLTPEGDVPLEDGEGGQGRESAALRQGSVPDRPMPADPYAEAKQVFADAKEAGAQTMVAGAAAFNLLANAAHRGDERVILKPHTPATSG